MSILTGLLLRCLGQLPLGLLQSLGSALGWLMLVIPSRRVDRVSINLALCLPSLSPDERQQLRRNAVINLGRTALETPRLWFGPERKVRALFREVTGMAHFEAARAKAVANGTGVIVLSPHLNWEAVMLYLATLGSSCFLYKPQNPRVEPLVRAGRSRFGTRFVHAIPGNVRQQLQKYLAKGDHVLVLPDQDPPPGRGEFAPFFGVPAHTPTLVGRLARSSGAPVVLLTAERLGPGRGFSFCFEPAPENIHHPDRQLSVAAVNQSMETCIRRCPDQYMWNMARFRNAPPGEPSPYRALKRR